MQNVKIGQVSSSTDGLNAKNDFLKGKVSFSARAFESGTTTGSNEFGSSVLGDFAIPPGESVSVTDASLVECAVTLPHLTSSGRSITDEDGQDAKALRLDLLNVFPEALRHVVADEAAAEAILTDNSVAAAAGYHRQFSEMALREIYSVMLRASAALDVRRRYLMRHSAPESDDATIRTLEASVLGGSQRDLSEWDEEWFQPLAPYAEPLRSVTLQAPRFVAGMLWNCDDRFLLGGTAFIEEARVLLVRWDSNIGNLTISGTDASLTEVSDKRTQLRLLLREYTSVSRVSMGCMVQTFSLIKENYPLKITRTQALPFDDIKDVMESCLPGSITRAFSLALLVPAPMRNSTMASSFFNDPHVKPSASHSPEAETLTPRSFSFTTLMDTSCSLSLTYQAAASTRRAAWRQPLGDEVYLRFSKPKLYAWVLQHEPGVLTSCTNIIREYMFYSERLNIRRLVRKLLHAVRTIQRFFRRLLTRKSRAVTRMLTQWTRLELECRERLKSSIPPPTVDDRLDFVVGSILWQHILTTEEFRMKMLDEIFTERRKAYHKWCAQRMEEQKAQQRMEDNINTDRDVSDLTFGSSEERDLSAIDYSISQDLVRSKWKDVVHERFGWFIDPEELLQESQRRLLLSLRSSILTIGDVRSEMDKMEKVDKKAN